ncbi:hypothetical protein MKX01_036099 [Papaver californicum]|nr:hypothetical protein MKX01_036099 [Papaver californicum]
MFAQISSFFMYNHTYCLCIEFSECLQIITRRSTLLVSSMNRFDEYMQAIFEVGELTQFYDSDKRFPVLGFGGVTAQGVVSHCLNPNERCCESENPGARLPPVLNSSTLFGTSIEKLEVI